MNRYIAIDPTRCTACGECLEACAAGHARAGRVGVARLALVEEPVCAALSCHHCEGAPCMKVCPVDAITRDDEGCVRVDEHRCIGCELCACTCPFGSIRMGATGISGVAGVSYPYPPAQDGTHPLLRWQIGEARVAVKCDLCANIPEGPCCVASCITNALRLVRAADGNGEARAKRVRAGLADLRAFENGRGGDAL